METGILRRWWDLPAAAILLVAMLAAASRLVATRWTDHLGITQTLVFFALIAGLALGQSRYKPHIVALFAVAYGVFAVPWQVGLLEGPDVQWSERLLSIVGRLEIIITQLVRQEVVQDSLLFIVLMSILFWTLGVHAGYTLTRYGNPWKTILPAGLVLLVIHSFDSLYSRRAWYLAVYLFFGLVLVARMAFVQKHLFWQQSRTALPPHLGLDFIRFTLFASGLIVLIAWTAPALASSLPAAAKAFQPVRQSWSEMRDQMDNAFASLRSSVGAVSEYYGDSMILGRGNKLSDTTVFQVKAPEGAPTTVRYYWRARTYDTYHDGQWLSTETQRRNYSPTSDPVIPSDRGRFLGTYDFTALSNVATLYSPAQPLWVSRPGLAEVAENPDGSLDFSSFRANPTLRPGEVWQAQASVANITIAQMRSAGTNYPSWVSKRYLQVPDTITERTRRLALELTKGLETPYDKVAAITSYLRSNITYADIIPAPPTDQDSLDWFLFDLKQGFCNYYASAQVMMLRSLGIPARWTVGFAQGEVQEDGSYLVRQRDSHAWPEVYFPGYGWVEFEPTAAQPEVNYPPGVEGEGNSAQIPSPLDLDQSLREMEEELRLAREENLRAIRDQRTYGVLSDEGLLRNVLWIAPLILGIGLVLALVWRSRDRIDFSRVPIGVESVFLKAGIKPPAVVRRWASFAVLPPLTKSYLEINKALGRLGSHPVSNATPNERAESLTHVLPPASTPTRVLVQEYQTGLFSQQPPDLPTARQAGLEIRKLSQKAMIGAFFQRLLRRLQKPSKSQ